MRKIGKKTLNLKRMKREKKRKQTIQECKENLKKQKYRRNENENKLGHNGKASSTYK